MPQSGFSVKLRRVRVSVPGPPPTQEVALRVNVNRKTALGTGGVSSGATAVRAQALSSRSTIIVKSGTSSFIAATASIVATLIQVAMNQRATYEWIPRDDNEALDSGQQGLATPSGGFLTVDIASSGASTPVRVETAYEE